LNYKNIPKVSDEERSEAIKLPVDQKKDKSRDNFYDYNNEETKDDDK
jgi:hypothetical protein